MDRTAYEQLPELRRIQAAMEAVRNRYITDLQKLVEEAGYSGVTFGDYAKLLQDIREFTHDITDDALAPVVARIEEVKGNGRRAA